MLSISQLAERWGVSENHVRRMVKSGGIVPVQISLPGARRKTWRFRLDDVIAWEESRLEHPNPKPARRRRKNPAVREYF